MAYGVANGYGVAVSGGNPISSDVDFSIQPPLFTALVSITEPDNAVISSVSFDVSSPEFTAGITISEPVGVSTSSIDFDVSAPQFNIDSVVTLPLPELDVNFDITKPEFSVFASVSGVAIIAASDAVITLTYESNIIKI